MACEDVITIVELQKAKLNAGTSDRFVNSANDFTPNQASPAEPEIRTLTGINSAANAAIGEIGGVDNGFYINSPLMTEYNQYVKFDRAGTIEAYKVKLTTPLNYQINFGVTPDPLNDANLQLFCNVSKEYVNANADLHDTLAGAKSRTDLEVGMVIIVEPELASGRFKVVSGETPNEIDVLSTAVVGVQLQLIKTNPVNPLHYGVVDDGYLPNGDINPSATDNASALSVAMADAENGSIGLYSSSTAPSAYYIGSNVRPKSNTTIFGSGANILCGGHTAVMEIYEVENILLWKVNIDGNQLAWTAFNNYTLPIIASQHVIVTFCEVFNGVNAGIGVGQILPGNHDIKILSNHVHHIGLKNHPNFYAYGNGVAVTWGEDVTIFDNHIHDIFDVGCINIEGTRLKNIVVSTNKCHTTTGRASGIKCYSGGVDVPVDNIKIIHNHLYEIGDITDINTEPTIWIEAGDGVTLFDNTVYDCPSVGKAGVIEATSDNTSLKVLSNKIRNCDGGRFLISGPRDLEATGNEVECTATTTLTDSVVPFYVETRSTGLGTSIVNNNLVKDAPYTSYIFNPTSSGDFTGNRLVRPNLLGGNYAIRSLLGFKNSRQGGNSIIVEGAELPAVAFYNFSGGSHQDMEYLPDIWKVPDLSLINKFDTSVNNYYIESSVAVKAGSNPAPTLGYNPRGRSIKTLNPQSGLAAEVFSTVAGTPGTWVGVPLP